jgi:hypothetical protein
MVNTYRVEAQQSVYHNYNVVRIVPTNAFNQSFEVFASSSNINKGE